MCIDALPYRTIWDLVNFVKSGINWPGITVGKLMTPSDNGRHPLQGSDIFEAGLRPSAVQKSAVLPCHFLQELGPT